MPYHKKTATISSDGGNTTDASIPSPKRQKTFDNGNDESIDSAAYTGVEPLGLITSGTSSTDAEDGGITPTAPICDDMREVSLSEKLSTSTFSDGNEADGEEESDVASMTSPFFGITGTFEPTNSVKVILSKAKAGKVQAEIEATPSCEPQLLGDIRTKITDLCSKCDLSKVSPNVHIDAAWEQATELLKSDFHPFCRFQFVSNLDDETCSCFAAALTNVMASFRM